MASARGCVSGRHSSSHAPHYLRLREARLAPFLIKLIPQQEMFARS